jgi:glycerol kinase
MNREGDAVSRAGWILALDQGTTSSRALLFDRAGRVVAQAARELPQIFPKPGWVEHDPEAIWSSQLAAAREALEKAQVAASDVAAIGITNQRETTILWERATGRPLANAIVWQCRRTAPLCEKLVRAGHAAKIRRRTGLVCDPYFSGTKLRWLLDSIPGARRRARRGELAFGTVDTWLAHRLSGGRLHVTDASNASRTLLFDLHRRRFDPELLELLHVPAAVLPEVRGSSEVLGECDPKWFGAALPIASMVGDQQGALFGQRCFAPGSMKSTYGTGCFLLMNTGAVPRASRSGLLTTLAWSRGGIPTYALEGSLFVAGAAVQWLRDGLGLIANAAEIEPLAASVPDSGGVTFVPAFVGLGAPHWDAAARGAIVGLTRGSTKAHLARATLEAMAFQTREVVECMERDAGLRVRELRIDGGATRNDLFCRILADLLGVAVVRPEQAEASATGAAYLAGLAVGFWKDERELAALPRAERRFEPTMTRAQRAAHHARWSEAVARVVSARR